MSSPVELLFSTPNLDPVKASILGLIPVFDRVARSGQQTIEQGAKAQVRAQTDASKQITKDADRAEKDRLRAIKETFTGIERALRDEIQLRNQVNQVEVRGAQEAARERTRALENEARQADAILRRRARGFGSTFGQATNRVLGIGGRVLGTAAALGGGYSIVDALRTGIQEEKSIGQLVRSSAVTGGLSTKDVQPMVRAAAIATGGTSGEMIEGVDAFIRETGDLKNGVDLMKDLARYSAASGASMVNLGAVAGQTFTHMGGDVGKTKEVLLALSGQAKAGAIDIRNLAEYGGRLVGSAELFQGSVGSNIETMGALTQIAKRKGGKIDAAEETESAARIFGEVSMHKDQFEALHVGVMGAGGKLRPVEDILLDTLVKTGGDITAIPKLFGRQAGGVETGLAQSFLEASGGRKDAASLAAGRAAAAAEIQGFRTPTSEGAIDEDVKKRLGESDAKLNQATERYHQSLERLQGMMPDLIDSFSGMIPTIQSFLDFFISHPWEGIGAVVGTAIVGEVAKAGIASGVTALFTKLGATVLGLFGASKAAAVANITAGVVNVAGGGGGDVADAVKGGGGAAAAMAKRVLGAGGVMAQGGFIVAAAEHEMNVHEKTKSANAALADVMGLPEGTPEQQAAKLQRLEVIKGKADEATAAHDAPVSTFGRNLRTGQTPGTLVGETRPEAEAFRKQLGAINSEIESLKAALSGVTPNVIAFSEAMKLPDGGTNPPGAAPSKWP